MNNRRSFSMNPDRNPTGLQSPAAWLLIFVLAFPSTLVTGALAADEEPTPLAGEAFHTEMLGEP